VLQNTGNGFQDAGCWISNINYINCRWTACTPCRPTSRRRQDGYVAWPCLGRSWYALILFRIWIPRTELGSGYGGFDVNRVRGLDVNGDGLTDIVLGPDSSGNVYAMESTGSWGPSGFTSGFVDKGMWVSSAVSWDGIANNGNIR